MAVMYSHEGCSHQARLSNIVDGVEIRTLPPRVAYEIPIFTEIQLSSSPCLTIVFEDVVPPVLAQ